MASVHDEKARYVLGCMADSEPSPDTFRELLTLMLPGWQKNYGEDGYKDEVAETSLKVSRALHSTLPAPFDRRDYLWRDMHGFREVLFFVDWPGRTNAELLNAIGAGVGYCDAVLGNR